MLLLQLATSKQQLRIYMDKPMCRDGCEKQECGCVIPSLCTLALIYLLLLFSVVYDTNLIKSETISPAKKRGKPYVK